MNLKTMWNEVAIRFYAVDLQTKSSIHDQIHDLW